MKVTSQKTDSFTPALRGGVVSAEYYLCSMLNLSSTISADITPKDLLFVDTASEQANAEKQRSEQTQPREYVFDDLDSFICQIFSITECIDEDQLQLYLYYMYGFYLLDYAGKSETKMQNRKLVHYTYPPKLFPATFITSRYGISVMEVYNKVFSGYYVSNIVSRRSAIHKQSEPYVHEMWLLIKGSLPDFLRMFTPLKPPMAMRHEQAFKENYDPETKIGNVLTDEDILRSTIARISLNPYSISEWKRVQSIRL